ncbi:hypothetical protein AB1Y20_019876 [Prymnesium parvum]|uniref:EF-hand domain-containing protein n=1 Tax=Prymnesium parvum TaxID=97485 RepID=A0AB34JT23_PRYPA
MRRRAAWLLVLAAHCARAGAWPRKADRPADPPPPPRPAALELLPLLEEEADAAERTIVGRVGRALFESLNSPRCRFVYRLLGLSLEEHAAVFAVRTFCNLAYCLVVLCGFLLFDQHKMIAITLITLPVGPTIVLGLVAALVGTLVAFAFFPITSVAAMLCWFVITSRACQSLGLYLGLDKDEDGDVDLLDLLAEIARTRVGTKLGLSHLHAWLNKPTDPLKLIEQKLESLERKLEFIRQSNASVRSGT